MALITVSGEPGCRSQEVARLTAQRLGWELISEARMRRMIEEEFGTGHAIPDRAIAPLVLSILARLGTHHHIVTTDPASESINPQQFTGLLRIWLTAPQSWRTGTLMVERSIDRAAARSLLAESDRIQKSERKLRSGRLSHRTHDHDLAFNSATASTELISGLIEKAVDSFALCEQGFLSAAAEARIQFKVRLELSKHSILPPSRVMLKRAAFVHPSEEIFANLLNFYRIAWEYEPRSFPIQWDKNGKVLEAFTPDFYLPEFDLYVELTTMKQAHVTKKNRKVKLLRAIYPDVNVQVFYQKDFQDLVFKHGLAERAAPV